MPASHQGSKTRVLFLSADKSVHVQVCPQQSLSKKAVMKGDTGVCAPESSSGASAPSAETSTTTVATRCAAQVQLQLVDARLGSGALDVLAVQHVHSSESSGDGVAFVPSRLQCQAQGIFVAKSGPRGVEQYRDHLGQDSEKCEHEPEDDAGHDAMGGCAGMNPPAAVNLAQAPPAWGQIHGKRGYIGGSRGAAVLFAVGIRWLIRNHKLIVAGFDEGFSATAASRMIDESSSSKCMEVKRGDILRCINGVDVLHFKQPPNAPHQVHPKP